MAKNLNKTNACRILDQAKIPYRLYTYATDGSLTGIDVANLIHQDPRMVFKTLVTTGKSGHNFVFVIPVAQELDLKKAALACGEKSVAMLKQKDLLPLTGYIHGACSPVGMKKLFPTFIHETVTGLPLMICSAGKLGLQMCLAPEDLQKVTAYRTADLIHTESDPTADK